MTNEQYKTGSSNEDAPLSAVPESARQHWLTPAVIFGGLEFTIPVLMVGATLAGSFGLSTIFIILCISLLVFQWVGNGLQGYIGAKTGRSVSVIARVSFGTAQARFIVGMTIFFFCIGWFAVQTAVAGNAIAAMLGIDYERQWFAWAGITIVCGLLFALPAVLGYQSMKWTDYIAVPAGLMLIGTGIYYALSQTGLDRLANWSPEPQMTVLAAINLVLGANVAQWVIASDYTRYAKPSVRDNALIPLGIIAIGFPLFFVGALMAVGIGDADIVNVMVTLGFPVWGFAVLWLATWTSQIVNNYSMGLALSNILDVKSSRGRAICTLAATVVAIIVALVGVLNAFEEFLNFQAIIYPPVAGVMMADFFLVKRRVWRDNSGWNWVATVALVSGAVFGAFTEYIVSMGIPAVQSLVLTAGVYWGLMVLKARVAPDRFTPDKGFSEAHP